MELSKLDTQKAKGAAVLGMVMLHLFCRLGNLPYTPWLWVEDVPLIYYLGLFGDCCVPIFCFCSGYAHYLLKEKEGANYARRIPGKLVRFLLNYWIVVILFSCIGLISGNGDTIPGSLSVFLGNVFLFRLSYNGAWWFVVTYILLLLLSPLMYQLIKKIPAIPVLLISGGMYFVSYMFRFDFAVEIHNSVLNWIWQQVILFGTSQFGYTIGMVAYKYKIVSGIRAWIGDPGTPAVFGKGCRAGVIVLLAAAFLGHCLIQSLFVAPFTAMAVLAFLFLLNLPKWADRTLLLLGKHSTNIWLTHMFFYLTVFEGLVFRAKYPVLILVLMMGICVGVSYIINWLYFRLNKRLICQG